MIDKLHLMRRWRLYALVGIPALVVMALCIAWFSGLASDLGTAVVAGPLVGGYGSADKYYWPATLEETIIGSDVVALVELESVSETVELYDYDGAGVMSFAVGQDSCSGTLRGRGWERLLN